MICSLPPSSVKAHIKILQLAGSNFQVNLGREIQMPNKAALMSKLRIQEIQRSLFVSDFGVSIWATIHTSIPNTYDACPILMDHIDGRKFQTSIPHFKNKNSCYRLW